MKLHMTARYTILILLLHITTLAGSITAEFENDLFAHTDYNYTNGVRVTYTTAPSLQRFFLLPHPPTSESHSWFQWMYTPRDIENPDPQLDDRPWAGMVGYTYTIMTQHGRSFWEAGLQTGIIGPSAYTKETQTIVHRVFSSRHPVGWHNQLSDYPVVNALYSYKYKAIDTNTFDTIVGIRGVAGSSLVYAGTDIQTRLGINIPNDYGRRRNEPVPFVVSRPSSFYLLTHLDGRAIAYNHTIDGARDHDISREIFVLDTTIGIGADFRNWSLVLSHTWRTKEFDTQDTVHRFGTVSVTRRL